MTVLTDWQELLFAKYRHSPNVNGTVELLAAPIQDSRDVLDWILDQNNLDDAEGEILNFRGELIGVTRPLAQEPDENLLWLCNDEDAADDIDGSMSLAPDDLSTGGYLTGDDGIPSVSDPGAYMADTEYRALIRSKAATYRQKATRSAIYDYLLTFGVRCKINETDREVGFEPHSYDALNYWARDYIVSRGFRPAGIRVYITEQLESDSEV